MQRVLLKKMLLVISVFLTLSSYAQSNTYSGSVLDENTGQNLEGATVTNQSNHAAVITDAQGSFTINGNKGDSLIISYIGYGSTTIALKDNLRLFIRLTKNDNSQLDEVVVVGYGTQKRKEFAGAVTKVNPLGFEHSPNSNVATALQGTVPGIMVRQSTGAPGASPNIVFRGGTGFDGSGDPLIVVDGVILNSLYGISMDDVESMDVLKDAASTAIYGARAANGVILITTKKGKKGRTQVNYSIKQSINKPRSIADDYLNAAQYIHMNRLGLRSRYIADSITGSNPQADKNQLNGAWGWAFGSTNTSPVGLYTTQLVTDLNRDKLGEAGWKLLLDPNPFNPGLMDSILYKESSTQEREAMLMRQSNSTEQSLSFSGADENGSFSLNLNSVKDNGTIIESWMKRINVNFNGSLNIGKNLNIQLMTNAYRTTVGSPYSDPGDAFGTAATGGLMQRFLGVAPTVRYYNDTSGAMLPGPNDLTLGNPNYWKNININSVNQERYMGSLKLTYNILPYLKFIANGSGYMLYQNNNAFTTSYQAGSGGAINTTRPSSFSNYKDMQYTYNGFLQFDKNFNGHNISIMAGGEYYDYKRYTFSGAGSGASTDLIPWVSAANTPYVQNGVIVNGQSASSAFAYWERIASAIGRVSYSYKDRYFAQGILRLDGSSRLDPSNYYGLFPGISAGWNMQNENFFKNSKLSEYISTIKPRISYGENGNLQYFGSNYYPTAQVYANAGTYNGQGASYASSYINPGVRWERTNSVNYGVDLGILHDRVTLVADYFVRNVFDKLASLGISSWTGFSSYSTNLSQLRNKGIELSLNAKLVLPKRPEGFFLDFGANFYSVKNYAVKLPYNGLPGNRQGTIQVWDPNHPGQLMQVGGLVEGKRIGTDEVWVPKWDGIYRTQAELDADANVVNSFLPYTGAIGQKFKQLGDAKWHQVYQNDTIDSRQYVFAGRTTPKASGSFFFNTGYKGFRLYAAFDYAYGFIILNQSRIRGLSQVQGSQNSTKEVLDTWTEENPDASLPRFYWANQGRNYGINGSGDNVAANLWEKGDYLMLREVTLSYSFPKEVLSQWFNNRIKGLELSLTGNNLSYLTSYTGIFPEVGGIDNGRYPLPRKITFGANITL